jgi:hypothetical protein
VWETGEVNLHTYITAHLHICTSAGFVSFVPNKAIPEEQLHLRICIASVFLCTATPTPLLLHRYSYTPPPLRYSYTTTPTPLLQTMLLLQSYTSRTWIPNLQSGNILATVLPISSPTKQ